MDLAYLQGNSLRLEVWEGYIVSKSSSRVQSIRSCRIDTSKNDSQKSTHGNSGTFLASVAALSILTITSHHCAHLQHASLILHHSRPAARLMPAPSHHHLSNREHGTRVTVQDLFGNMPVRVKHRAVGCANGETEKLFEVLKKQIVGLLLAWHRPVVVSLKDVVNNRMLRIRRKEAIKHYGVEDGFAIRKLDLLLVCSILSQAGYIEPSSWDEWIKASARTPFIVIRGAISTQPAPSKQAQFISLGINSIITEKGGNVLYDEINRLFALSSFGNQEDVSGDEGSNKARRDKDKRFKQNGYTNRQLKGGGKGVDRWPMFYIRVELESKAQDHRGEVDQLREGTLSSILKILSAMINSFLEENHFRPRARTQRRKPNAPRKSPLLANTPDLFDSCGKKRPPNVTNYGTQEHEFSSWGRIKSGTHVVRQAAIPSLGAFQSQELPTKRVKLVVPERDDDPALASRPSAPPQDTDSNPPKEQHSEQTIEWRNAISGADVLINARTGLVLAPQKSRRPSSAPPASNPSALVSASSIKINALCNSNEKVARSVSSQFRTLSAGSWSSELLKRWENPVFSTTETDIPQVSLDGPSIETSDILHGRRHCCTGLDIQKAFKQSSSAFSAQLSKKALKRAEVVAQIDQKFILIRMEEGSSTSKDHDGQLLVLVDQHAADERIRVEGLLADLSSNPTSLAKPIIFEIPARENELLTRHAAHFTSWGIVYNITAAPGSPICRLNVKALPAAIAERCRVEPKVLIEMLRGEAWKREESGLRSRTTHGFVSPSPSGSKNDSWLARVGTCPQGLLDMLNSRACRSAVMFNDVLTIGECQTLIQRLGDCAFPFQCAHGRPSMIPLVNLGSSMGFGTVQNAFGARDRASDTQRNEFGAAWKRWKLLEADNTNIL